MNPAPPVMHTRVLFSDIRASSPRVAVSGPRFGAREEPGVIASEGKELFARDAVALERRDLLARAFERRDDDQIELHALVIPNGLHRDAEKLRPGFGVEDRDRLEAVLLERQVGQLRRLAASVDR